MPKQHEHNHGDEVAYYVCQICGEKFPPVQKVVIDHINTTHAKEMARLDLDRTKLRAKDTSDPEAQLAVAEGVAEYTRKFLVDDADKVSAYTVDEALGSREMHLMYQRVMDCGYPGCTHNGPDPATVDKAIAKMNMAGDAGSG